MIAYEKARFCRFSQVYFMVAQIIFSGINDYMVVYAHFFGGWKVKSLPNAQVLCKENTGDRSWLRQ